MQLHDGPPLPAVPTPPPGPIVLGDVEVRPDECEVLIAGRRARLTVREFQVFHVLAQHPDRVVRREQLYTAVWGGQMAHRDRSVDVFVRKVRTKLTAISPDVAYIHTHFGIGYRLAPQPIPPADAA